MHPLLNGRRHVKLRHTKFMNCPFVIIHILGRLRYVLCSSAARQFVRVVVTYELRYRDLTLEPLRLVEDLTVPSTADPSCISFGLMCLILQWIALMHAYYASASYHIASTSSAQLSGDSKPSRTEEEPTVAFLSINLCFLPSPHISADTS